MHESDKITLTMVETSGYNHAMPSQVLNDQTKLDKTHRMFKLGLQLTQAHHICLKYGLLKLQITSAQLGLTCFTNQPQLKLI